MAMSASEVLDVRKLPSPIQIINGVPTLVGNIRPLGGGPACIARTEDHRVVITYPSERPPRATEASMPQPAA